MKNRSNKAGIKALARDPKVQEDLHGRAVRVQRAARTEAPFETGHLRESIEIDEHDDGYRVEAKADYAWFQDKGTRYVPATYFMTGAIDAARD